MAKLLWKVVVTRASRVRLAPNSHLRVLSSCGGGSGGTREIAVGIGGGFDGAFLCADRLLRRQFRTVQDGFGTHSIASDLQWVISVYMLTLGTFTVPASRIGDIFSSCGLRAEGCPGP
jgi:hypothetical protein